jgi:hypothetical protein
LRKPFYDLLIKPDLIYLPLLDQIAFIIGLKPLNLKPHLDYCFSTDFLSPAKDFNVSAYSHKCFCIWSAILW